jgi:hypothetical protein
VVAWLLCLLPEMAASGTLAMDDCLDIERHASSVRELGRSVRRRCFACVGMPAQGGRGLHIGGSLLGTRSRRPEWVSQMKYEDALWDLEERFWTQGAESARQMTARDAVFVFPYPAGILQGDAVWREKEVAQRWRSVVMSDRYAYRKDDIAVLAYRVSAERSGEPIYEALCTSTYLMDENKWVRLSHQQTPVG